MKDLQRVGGIAALIGTATNLLALVMFITLQAPKGYGSDDPGQTVPGAKLGSPAGKAISQGVELPWRNNRRGRHPLRSGLD